MRGKRIDANQNEVVRHLRKLGFSVAITSMVGNGFPDLIVSNYAHTLLVELKDGSKPPSARALTSDEQKFHDTWKGNLIVAESLTDILKFFKY